MIILLKIIAWIFLLFSLLMVCTMGFDKHDRKNNKGLIVFFGILLLISIYFALIFHAPDNNSKKIEEPATTPITTSTNESKGITVAPTSTVIPTPTITPTTQPEKANTIIGSTRENTRTLLKSYKETKSNMGSNTLDFENKDLLITVYFSTDGMANGVIFMQNSFDGVNDLTGDGSSVSKRYDELVKLATKDSGILIETDLTKYNSKGVKKKPMELYIGKIPH